VLDEMKQADASVAESARASSALRDSDRVALASGTHLPQQLPTPSSRLRSRKLHAPPLTADRMCRSDTALQMQMIMALL
jgi:hypothetical protein